MSNRDVKADYQDMDEEPNPPTSTDVRKQQGWPGPPQSVPNHQVLPGLPQCVPNQVYPGPPQSVPNHQVWPGPPQFLPNHQVWPCPPQSVPNQLMMVGSRTAPNVTIASVPGIQQNAHVAKNFDLRNKPGPFNRNDQSQGHSRFCKDPKWDWSIKEVLASEGTLVTEYKTNFAKGSVPDAFNDYRGRIGIATHLREDIRYLIFSKNVQDKIFLNGNGLKVQVFNPVEASGQGHSEVVGEYSTLVYIRVRPRPEKSFLFENGSGDLLAVDYDEFDAL